jgi:acetate---CoA ligase (ADP-forming)
MNLRGTSMHKDTVDTLDPVFRPRSIAVIGASRTPGTVGHEIVHNLLIEGFSGALYPVNPKATSVHSVPAYGSIRDIPQPVDVRLP